MKDVPRRHHARLLAPLVALLIAGAGTAVAVAPLELPRTTFRELNLPAPAQKDGLERRWWGLEVRTTGDDVPFPEREPAVFVAARDVDPKTQLVKSVVIVVRNARASGWLGGPGATAKVETLQTNALQGAVALLDDPQARERSEGEGGFADALAEAAPALPGDKRQRVVAVLPVASEWPALDRALAFALTESLVKSKAADVVDLETAERFLADLGIEPRLVKDVDPPLAIWAQALGVDAVAAVRATNVRAVTSADDGPDLLAAEVLWSRADGGLERTATSIRVPHRTYPARGKLKIVLAHADDLSEEMIPKLPEAGTGARLFASRDMQAASASADRGGAMDSGSGDPRTGDRAFARESRDVSGAGAHASGSGEDVGIAGPGFREGSGDVRPVPFADAFGRGSSEDAANPSVAGRDRAAGGTRTLRGTSTASGATMETLSLGSIGPNGSTGGERGVNGANGGRGGAMEDLALAGGGGDRGSAGRGVDGANGRSGSGMDDLTLDGPGSRDGRDGRDGNGADANGRREGEELALIGPGDRGPGTDGAASTRADLCSLQPRARELGPGAWLVHHALNEREVIPDGDPMLAVIARTLAADRGARVRVVGYTCSVGETSYNFTLGSRRADTTRERLIELGVPSSQIDSVSEGEENPICTNDTRVGRMNNRRTEIRIEPGSDRTEDR